MNSADLVHKLWSLCHILRDDGITYHQYVTELTYLLFLKMAEEIGVEADIPTGYRWADLVGRPRNESAADQLECYRQLLAHLGTCPSRRVRAMFAGARTALRRTHNLQQLCAAIDQLDWYSARREGLGDMYEGLLARNATETRGGAGQYFTPRSLVEAIVACVRPQPGETVHDPALGTGGFLTEAHRHVQRRASDSLTAKQREFQKRQAFTGIELVPDVHRLALMNLHLHGIESDIECGDTLSPLGAGVARADVILTNPPFGARRGSGRPERDDFTHATANKQLAFLQHVYGALKIGGRAAVVLSDNALFEDSVGQRVRAELMDRCRLHTILRLPTGIFYAHGVNTNVAFFTRGPGENGNTDRVWVYDMRTGAPSFGKRNPLTRAHFDDFLRCYGDCPDGTGERCDTGATGRWRAFTRADIAARGDDLDISWLCDDSAESRAELADPDAIAGRITEHLHAAIAELTQLRALLSPPPTPEDGQ